MKNLLKDEVEKLVSCSDLKPNIGLYVFTVVLYSSVFGVYLGLINIKVRLIWMMLSIFHIGD